MLTIPAAIILASLCQAPMSGWSDESIPIYQCDFEYESDLNYDGWPDGWSRKSGRGYPKYLKVKIEREADVPESSANRRLVVRMNGGAAAAYTPHIPVHARFSYMAKARIRLKDFKHDAAFISIRFYDAAGEVVEVQESKKLQLADNWQDVEVGPLAPRHAQTASAVVGIHAAPMGEDYDIFATAEFDDLQILKIPKLILRGNRDDLIYTAPDQVAVTCQLSGTHSREATIHFEVADINGKIVDRAEIPTTGSPIFLETATREDGLPTEKQTAGFHFEQSWTPKLPGFGF